MRDPLSCRRAPDSIWGHRIMVEDFFCYFWRDHIAVKGPRFPFEVTKFRVKTFFFGDHLAVKGIKIPFKGPELWVKTFSLLETRTSQRSAMGPHWGKLPTPNCKAFSLKISTRSLSVDLKKGYPENGVAFHIGQSSAQLQFYPTISQFFHVFN